LPPASELATRTSDIGIHTIVELFTLAGERGGALIDSNQRPPRAASQGLRFKKWSRSYTPAPPTASHCAASNAHTSSHPQLVCASSTPLIREMGTRSEARLPAAPRSNLIKYRAGGAGTRGGSRVPRRAGLTSNVKTYGAVSERERRRARRSQRY
jgi:hypothetical protein